MAWNIMNKDRNILDYLEKLKDFYKKSTDNQQMLFFQLIDTILESKDLEEISFEIKNVEKIDALSGREVLIEDIELLEDEAMLIVFQLNQTDAIKQLYGAEVLKEVITDKASKLKSIINESGVSLYSISFQKFAILVRDKALFDRYFSILKFSIFNNIDNSVYNSKIYGEILSDFTVGVSYGRDHLYHRANIAIQEAVLSKSRYKIYDKNADGLELKKATLDKFRVYKTALHDGHIVPYFQPIVSASTEEIIKYEALARLVLPDGRVISPIDFLNTAIEDKTFEFFTRQMMQKVFIVYGNNSCEISINLTYENIKSKTMLEYIKNRLEKYGGERITFEIVETEEIVEYKIVENFIKMVKEYGCKISIDDFGSGYSNFTNLFKLDIDYIKIDGTITTRLLDAEKARIMIRGLVGFAKSVNVKTIAEFVSSKELFECVRKLGVDYVQGYYHGEPKNAKDYGLE
ncbi:EAL domain-containing protein [Sulfurimonas sp.]|uniref:EAL domain-containing protein n=1 Tax=Sulfurimonas sp. TaxID=2022749 RepID=UPI0025E78C32|nr:EAL domain-containing protein [Sulfurimonas sp.]